MRLQRLCALRRARDGVSTIEFAFVSAILCALTLGVLDFGMGFYKYMQVQSAAQAGAQYAMLNPGATNTNISSELIPTTIRWAARPDNVPPTVGRCSTVRAPCSQPMITA